MNKNTTKQKKTENNHNTRCNKTVKLLVYEWCDLDLTSQLVLYIGAFLLAELILSTFFYPGKDHLSINIVFRTGLSSVMGYILGGMNSANTHLRKTSPPADSTSNLNEIDALKDNTISLQNAPSLRAIIATFVCLVCIICLFLALTFNHLQYPEGLNQMRDLISTTIGFLISNSRQHT